MLYLVLYYMTQRLNGVVPTLIQGNAFQRCFYTDCQLGSNYL